MKFTDIFIRRPVLACVISLMLLVVGLKAFYALPILEYPKTENAVVTITTVYYGADPETVAGFVTTPLENAIAQANGIDYLSSNSRSGDQHDHRQPGAELRSRQGHHRDHREDQLGAQPVAGGRAAADSDGGDRPVARRADHWFRQ